MSMQIKIDDREVVRGFERLGAVTLKAVVGAVDEISARMLRVTGERIRPFNIEIANSIQARPATMEKPEAVIGSAHPGARIWNYGGVIRPNPNPGPDLIRRRVFGAKPISHLTLPIGAAQPGDRARDFDGLFVWVNPSTKKAFLAQSLAEATRIGSKHRTRGFQKALSREKERGLARGTDVERGQGFRLLFALVPSVTIKAHPYMYFSQEDEAFAGRVVTRNLRAVMAGAEGGEAD